MAEPKIKKRSKTFKDYYADPEFKARHDARMKEKVTCRCGAVVTNYNLSHHKASFKCQEKIAALDKQQANEKAELEEAMKLALQMIKNKKQIVI